MAWTYFVLFQKRRVVRGTQDTTFYNSIKLVKRIKVTTKLIFYNSANVQIFELEVQLPNYFFFFET